MPCSCRPASRWLCARSHRNRLRSALTLLGVTIGVAVVITMVAIGTGARQSIEQHVKAAGTNQITVVAGNYMRIADDYGSDVIESGGGGNRRRRSRRPGGRFRRVERAAARTRRQATSELVAGQRHLAAAARPRRGD